MAKPLSPTTITFGQRVRACRTELEWTQEQLAEAAELHWTYVGQVERGERNISLRNMSRISSALDVDLAHLCKELKPW